MEDSKSSEIESSPTHRKNRSFGKDLPHNHLEVWNREGCNLVAVVPTTVHRR